MNDIRDKVETRYKLVPIFRVIKKFPDPLNGGLEKAGLTTSFRLGNTRTIGIGDLFYTDKQYLNEHFVSFSVDNKVEIGFRDQAFAVLGEYFEFVGHGLLYSHDYNNKQAELSSVKFTIEDSYVVSI